MRLLVTGGAGFIGSCFVRHVLKKHPDYKIINLDALTYCGNLENLNDLKDNPNHTFVKGNICYKKLAQELISEVDCVVNFAAESHVDNSIKHPEIFVETNVQGTLNLLQVSKELGVDKEAVAQVREFAIQEKHHGEATKAIIDKYAPKEAETDTANKSHTDYQQKATSPPATQNFYPYFSV